MTEEEIHQLALSNYPVSQFWIGAGSTSQLYDENSRDRAVFIKGIKAALSMSGVSNCISNDLVDCGNCGEKVRMISTGEMCPKCFC